MTSAKASLGVESCRSEVPLTWRRVRLLKVIAVAVVGVFLALPNIGPTAIIHLVTQESLSQTVELNDGRKFAIVGCSVLLHDHVVIRRIYPGGASGQDLLSVSSGGRPDMAPSQVLLQDDDGGLRIVVRGRKQKTVFVSQERLRTLSYFGPQHIVAGELMPLWTLFDMVDALLLWGVTLLWFSVKRASDSSST